MSSEGKSIMTNKYIFNGIPEREVLLVVCHLIIII